MVVCVCLGVFASAGKDHVLFNFMDSDFIANIGAAVLVKSSFGPPLDLPELRAFVNNSEARDNAWYRPGFDVQFPLSFYRCGFHPESHLMMYDNATIRPVQVRGCLYWAVAVRWMRAVSYHCSSGLFYVMHRACLRECFFVYVRSYARVYYACMRVCACVRVRVCCRTARCY